MAEMSEIKKFVLGLSDKEIMALLGMAEKRNRPVKNAANASGSGKAWYEKMISGLDKNGEKHLDELKNQLRDPGTSHHVDKKQVRYLNQLKKMRLEVPPFFSNIIDPKAMYKHLVGFCKENDIPEEIVARVVPALISYIETGHMRPVIFVGEKGCGKTTAVKLLVEEALKLPTEVIKVPQTGGGYGMTGVCGTYQSADAGCIAKARLRADSLIVAYVFDEIDKVPHDSNRASVDDELLSITDESCADVTDNYLETTLVGLEHCPMFFTANDLQKVSPILADRCTVIKFPNADASRIKSISRKYADKQLTSNLYSMIRFNYELMETHIDNLVQHNVTSLRKHQQLIESVLGNALNIALVQETEEVVDVTEDMFVDAEQAVLGTVKRRTGFY